MGGTAHKRGTHLDAGGAGETPDRMLVTHAAFILGTTLALLAGLLLGLIWGARLRLGPPRERVPAPSSPARLTRPVGDSIITPCLLATSRGTRCLQRVSGPRAGGGSVCSA